MDLPSIGAAVRTAVLVPLFFCYSLVLASIVIVYGWFRPAAPLHDRIVRNFARVFLAIAPVRIAMEGRELIDPEVRYVVVSNHLSMFDIPLLFHVLPIKGRFLSKKELFRIPLIGQAMRTIGIVEIDRASSGSSRAAINEGVTLAAERGYSLIVFAEGTRSRDGELLPFKKGAFRIAIDTGLPLLPVVIEGTNQVSRPGSKVIRPGTVKVRVLPPIATADLTNRDDLNPLVKQVEADITETYLAMRAAR